MMHPRNPFKEKPDFVKLAKKYSFFEPFVIQNANNGKSRIDFKNIEALRSLSRVLLLDTFGLNVEIPENSLIPTIPLRVNYILWIEDLIQDFICKEFPEQKEVRGLDIGTGATAIYAILGAKLKGWKIIGTDINSNSIDMAKKNGENNNLNHLLEFKLIKEDIPILDQVIDMCDLSKNCKSLDFSICNPPFFSNDDEEWIKEQEILINRRKRTGNSKEVSTEGGEVQFVENMILQSVKYSNRIKIFTTMIGIKSDLKILCTILKSKGITNFTTTEFCQGKTTRWGLAWTFYENIKLKSTTIKLSRPLITKFENIPVYTDFKEKLKSILTQELELSIINEDNDNDELEIKAFRNTWSQQRRHFRQNKKIKLETDQEKAAEKIEESTNKSKNETEKSTISTLLTDSKIENVCVHFNLTFKRDGLNVLLELEFIDGSLGKDGINQILQYIKNKLKIENIICSQVSK